MLSLSRIAFAMLMCLITVTSCGSSAPDRDAIQLQANAVGGGQIFYEDLASQDTVLWFWAPW